VAATVNDRFVTIAGSLYLIGEAMELLHLSATRQANERRLNEWSAIAAPAHTAVPARR
jgi:hypothetical protein